MVTEASACTQMKPNIPLIISLPGDRPCHTRSSWEHESGVRKPPPNIASPTFSHPSQPSRSMFQTLMSLRNLGLELRHRLRNSGAPQLRPQDPADQNEPY
jgi:hypothetical protein